MQLTAQWKRFDVSVKKKLNKSLICDLFMVTFKHYLKSLSINKLFMVYFGL